MPLQLTTPVFGCSTVSLAGVHCTVEVVPQSYGPQEQEVYLRFAYKDAEGNILPGEWKIKLTGQQMLEFFQQFVSNEAAVWQFLIDRGHVDGTIV